jgi:hypothetical protein
MRKSQRVELTLRSSRMKEAWLTPFSTHVFNLALARGAAASPLQVAVSAVALTRSRETAGLPNGPHAKLRGQWPRGDANSGRVVAATEAHAEACSCNHHDAEQVLFGPGASAPDQSRAATASAWSWAARTRERSGAVPTMRWALP